MKLTKIGVAGTEESSDIVITVAPADEAGIHIELSGKPVVLKQFGRQMKAVITQTVKACGVENVKVSAKDSGALDYTIIARVRAAVLRAV